MLAATGGVMIVLPTGSGVHTMEVRLDVSIVQLVGGNVGITSLNNTSVLAIPSSKLVPVMINYGFGLAVLSWQTSIIVGPGPMVYNVIVVGSQI